MSRTLSGFLRVFWHTICGIGISQDFSAISREIERTSLGCLIFEHFSFFSFVLQDILYSPEIKLGEEELHTEEEKC